MPERVALKLELIGRLILFAATLMIIAMPAAFGQLTAPQQSQAAPQTAADQAQPEQTQKVPEWQTAAGGKMSFEVASIRLSKPGTFTPPNFALRVDDSYVHAGGLLTADFPLSVYIEFAYKLWLTQEQRESLLADLPKWVATDHFEIHAQAPGNPTKDQMRLMMQSLLADRFKLAVHFETRQIPVFALTLIKPGKLGPALRLHADGPACDAPMPQKPAQGSPANGPGVFPPECGGYMIDGRPGQMILGGSRDTTMDLIADFLTSIPGGADRPVIDRTGLSGRYNFTVQWTPESKAPPGPGTGTAPDISGPTFLDAVKEQLGLKLVSTKAPVETLVIDHVELPSEN